MKIEEELDKLYLNRKDLPLEEREEPKNEYEIERYYLK